MRVWILTWLYCDGGEMIGVYDSREKAEAARAERAAGKAEAARASAMKWATEGQPVVLSGSPFKPLTPDEHADYARREALNDLEITEHDVL